MRFDYAVIFFVAVVYASKAAHEEPKFRKLLRTESTPAAATVLAAGFILPPSPHGDHPPAYLQDQRDER